MDRDEPRFAEASREMRERGDYVVPYLNNKYRFDKPAFIYWTQIASYTVFGENDFAARFPSAVAAALTAVLLFAWGRRLGSERIGWWAAFERFGGYSASVITGLLGFAQILWDRNRQALHDKISETVVVRT